VQILISHHALDAWGGTETYMLTIGAELQRLGHAVVLYAATGTGQPAEIARERGLSVATKQEDLPPSCDALIAQDAGTAMSLAARFPDAIRLYVAHSNYHPLQVPPQINGVCDAIVVMSDRVQAFVEALAWHSKIVRLRQPVDLKRFGVFPPRTDDGRRRALLLGNYLRGQSADVVAAACKAAGLELLLRGHHTQPTNAPEREIAAVDVVIGFGRCVVEALAGRRAAYVYGLDGGDGWVTPDSYDALEADGFGGHGLELTVTPDRLAAELAAWDPRMGEINRRLAAQHHDATRHATELVALIKSLGGPCGATLTSADELARLVRVEWESWGRYIWAIEELRKERDNIARQRTANTELEARAAELSATVTSHEQEIAALRCSLAEREAKNTELEARAAELSATVTSHEQEIAAFRCSLAERNIEVAALKGSTSWLVTGPLRGLGGVAKLGWRAVRIWFGRVLQH
jgi:hypothetical protein